MSQKRLPRLGVPSDVELMTQDLYLCQVISPSRPQARPLMRTVPLLGGCENCRFYRIFYIYIIIWGFMYSPMLIHAVNCKELY